MANFLLSPVATCCCFRLKPAQYLPSHISVLSYKSHRFHPDGSSSHLFSPRRLSHSFPRKKRKSSCMVVYASLFGVGAPEALVIGVVALLVFGPKGLAEIARNLGKTLRAFQPTIRELQEVSREFKSTLEREIGMDEVSSSSNSVYRSNSIFNENQHTTSDPNGKPTSKAPLVATESPEEQSQEAVTSPSPSQDASTTVAPEINAQTSSSDNAGEGSK